MSPRLRASVPLALAGAALACAAPGAPAATTGGVQYGAASQSPAAPDPTAPAPAPAPPRPPRAGQVARVLAGGLAVAPAGAPAVVRRIIAAGNRIARTRYRWGGGHARWEDRGYDCSGSVSYALHGAGLLDAPLVSGSFARWGESGTGAWVTIYANAGHVYMVVAGLRFDTSGLRRAGSRWQAAPRSARGFAVRHPSGL